MIKISKYQQYKIIRFIAYSFFIIFFFYIKMDAPLTLIIIFEILLIIKTLPTTQFIEKVINKYFTKYNSLNNWIKRLIIFGFFILIFIIIKFVIIDVLVIKILDIPIEQQIYDFIERASAY